MLRVAMCDDEQCSLEMLAHMLEAYGKSHDEEIVATPFLHPFDLIDQTENNVAFDLFMLDVYMPELGGIAMAQQLRRQGVDTPIIFLTSSRDHALEAFGVGAVGYLLKPIDKGTFTALMEQVCSNLKPKNNSHYILVKSEGDVTRLAFRDILYTEAHKNLQYIHLTDGSSLPVRMTVAELFEQLSVSQMIVRCGTAFLVNLAKVRCINPKAAMMVDGTSIPIPRGAYAPLKDAYYRYYQDKEV